MKSVLLKSANGKESEYHTETRSGYTEFNKDGTGFSDFGFVIDNENFTYTIKNIPYGWLLALISMILQLKP